MKSANVCKLVIKAYNSSEIFQLLLPLYVFISKVAVVESHHSISSKMRPIPKYQAYRPIPRGNYNIFVTTVDLIKTFFAQSSDKN